MVIKEKRSSPIDSLIVGLTAIISPKKFAEQAAYEYKIRTKNQKPKKQ